MGTLAHNVGNKQAQGRISERVLQEKEPPNVPNVVRVSGGKKCSFFGKFGVLCFLVTTVLRFALMTYCTDDNGLRTAS